MKKEKLTQEQKEERFSRIKYKAISIILWILGLSVATMFFSACVLATKNIIEIIIGG